MIGHPILPFGLRMVSETVRSVKAEIVAENLYDDPLRLGGFLLQRNNFPKAP